MDTEQLEDATNEAIRQCDGDARAAVRALLILLEYWQAEAAQLAETPSPDKRAVTIGKRGTQKRTG